MRAKIEKLIEANNLDDLKKYNHYDLLGVNKNAVNEAFSRDVVKRN